MNLIMKKWIEKNGKNVVKVGGCQFFPNDQRAKTFKRKAGKFSSSNSLKRNYGL